jgi:hypothetical protein
MGISSVGGGGFRSAGNVGGNIPASLAKHLKSPEFSNILSSLGINKQDIANLVEHKGLQGDLSFKEAQVIQVDTAKAAALKSMGLVGAQMALVLESEDEIKKIKKRLNEIQESPFNKKELGFLLGTLGLDFDEDSIVYTDQTGGLVIIRSAIQSLEESLDEDEDGND